MKNGCENLVRLDANELQMNQIQSKKVKSVKFKCVIQITSNSLVVYWNTGANLTQTIS